MANEVVGTQTNHNTVCGHEYGKQRQQQGVWPRHTRQFILFVRVWRIWGVEMVTPAVKGWFGKDKMRGGVGMTGGAPAAPT